MAETGPGPMQASVPISRNDEPNAAANPIYMTPVSPVGGTAEVDVVDRAARLLGIVYGDVGQLLQRPVTRDALVQLRSAGVEIDPRQIRTLTSADVVDVSDRAARLLGVVYGDQAQLLQRAGTFDLQVQLRSAGIEIDPRQIRALTSADVVDVSDRAARLLGVVYGSQAQQLLQRAVTFDLQVQLRSAGVEYDARQIRALTAADQVDVSDRAARLLGIVYGDVGQLLQRPVTRDALVQLRSAGVEIDPRQIRTLTSADVVDVSDRIARLVGIVNARPSDGAQGTPWHMEATAAGAAVAFAPAVPAGKKFRCHSATLNATRTTQITTGSCKSHFATTGKTILNEVVHGASVALGAFGAILGTTQEGADNFSCSFPEPIEGGDAETPTLTPIGTATCFGTLDGYLV